MVLVVASLQCNGARSCLALSVVLAEVLAVASLQGSGAHRLSVVLSVVLAVASFQHGGARSGFTPV